MTRVTNNGKFSKVTFDPKVFVLKETFQYEFCEEMSFEQKF